MVVAKDKQANRIAKLERDVKTLKARSAKSQSVSFTITTFAPHPIKVIKPIIVTVQPSNGRFVASFVDANINASGDTDVEAVAALKDYMSSYFRLLDGMHPKQLGPGPKRQVVVLREFIKQR